MKNKRQEALAEIVSAYEVDTQAELIDRLRERGFEVTQATISRDIRQLKLIKTATGHGGYKYMLPPKNDSAASIKLNDALVESIKRVSRAGNIVVLRTYPGLANAVAAGIDGIDIPSILGCVAGDDTILVVAIDEKVAEAVEAKVNDMTSGKK